ncbi:MAG: hypothetical protein EPN39_02595 [Chitinophagaceae bacterium]|nr:MAG: hypothetical protein EPN39_02595 [Chitinophagaceae bacterium]
MKKIIILFLVLSALYSSSDAQITKGNWMVGGDASFSLDYTRYEYDEIAPTHGFRGLISPGVGYFLIDKLTMGLKADLNFNHFRNGTPHMETQFSLNTGPFLRYYFLPAENIINIFGGAAYEHFFHTYANPANTYSVFAGPTFFFNSSVAAELLAGLDYFKPKGNAITTSFKVNIGLQIYLKK